MSIVLENVIMFAPWALGVAGGGLTAYYANNFDTADVDTSRGNITGVTGNSWLGVSAANLAVQSWAIFEWMKMIAKIKEGKIISQNRNRNYGRAMMWFWWLMLLFYVVVIVSNSLNVHLITNYNDVDVQVDGDKLNGGYGDAVEGLSYTVLALGGVNFFLYLYAELFTRDLKEPHPTFIETHGGDR